MSLVGVKPPGDATTGPVRRYYGRPVIRATPLDPAGWSDAGGWLPRARRSGSLRYSDLGRRPVPPPGPLEELAAWLVDAADGWWERAGRPDPFTLVVESADDGTLARRVLELGPACLTCLRYVLVHPDPAPPAMAALLPLEDPVYLFPMAGPAPRGGEAHGPGGRGAPDADRAVAFADDGDEGEAGDEEPEEATGVGPLVTRVAGLPALPGPGALVAIATVGCLPSDRVEYRDGRWEEVRLAATGPAGAATGPAGDRPDTGAGWTLVEVTSPLAPAAAPRFLGRPGPGRYPVLTGAVDWLREALSGELEGVVAVVDHWTATTAALPGDTVPPLAVDQLARVRAPLDRQPEPVAGGLSVVVWPTRRA